MEEEKIFNVSRVLVLDNHSALPPSGRNSETMSAAASL
jgi:hypothetical protein